MQGNSVAIKTRQGVTISLCCSASTFAVFWCYLFNTHTVHRHKFYLKHLSVPHQTAQTLLAPPQTAAICPPSNCKINSFLLLEPRRDQVCSWNKTRSHCISNCHVWYTCVESFLTLLTVHLARWKQGINWQFLFLSSITNCLCSDKFFLFCYWNDTIILIYIVKVLHGWMVKQK